MNLELNYLCKISIELKYEMSSYNFQEVIENAFNVYRLLKEEVNNLYNEYRKSRDVYYSKLEYYKKCGGIYPLTTFREILKEIEITKSRQFEILSLINKYKQIHKYDLGFKEYLEMF